MAHFLVLELPGGNDTDILEAILTRGDHFTFLTSDLAVYRRQDHVVKILDGADEIIEIPQFDHEIVTKEISRRGSQTYQGVICIVDIRIVDAAHLAKWIGVPFLEPEKAFLLRDKFSVREKILAAGVGGQGFKLACSEMEMRAAIEDLGFPVVIKPCDGYASQNIVLLHGPEDLEPWISPLSSLADLVTDYGLGVTSNQRWLVEKYLSGKFIGVDTMTHRGRHKLIGVNEKLMFPTPSFAIKGGTFSPPRPEMKDVEEYAFSLLDAVGYNHGAAHVEIMLTEEGPQLVEINPRLVSAKIPRLMNIGLGRNIYNDLLDLHLGVADFDKPQSQGQFAVSRWIVANQDGKIESITCPGFGDDRIRIFEILKKMGDDVRPPFENADRIGYVMTSDEDQTVAENLADRWISEVKINYACS